MTGSAPDLKDRERRRRRRETRRRLGQCLLCGGHPRPGKTYCQRCAQRISRCQQARYGRRKRQNLCVNCGQPARTGLTTCLPCSQRTTRNSRRSQALQRQEARSRAQEDRLYDEQFPPSTRPQRPPDRHLSSFFLSHRFAGREDFPAFGLTYDEFPLFGSLDPIRHRFLNRVMETNNPLPPG